MVYDERPTSGGRVGSRMGSCTRMTTLVSTTNGGNVGSRGQLRRSVQLTPVDFALCAVFFL